MKRKILVTIVGIIIVAIISFIFYKETFESGKFYGERQEDIVRSFREYS